MASFGLGSLSTPASPTLPIEECTPWVAAGDGDIALLQTALTSLNLPPNAADPNGFTFVHAAASYSQQHVLRWLLGQSGVDVNAGDIDGDTPLHHCDDSASARILVEEGSADPFRRNAAGKTAREAKEEELAEELGDEDDSDDEDRGKLEALVQYLKGLEGGEGTKDENMQ